MAKKLQQREKRAKSETAAAKTGPPMTWPGLAIAPDAPQPALAPRGDDDAMGEGANIGPDDEEHPDAEEHAEGPPAEQPPGLELLESLGWPSVPSVPDIMAIPPPGSSVMPHPLSNVPQQQPPPSYLDTIRRARQQSKGQGLSVDRELLSECADAIEDLIGFTGLESDNMKLD